MKRILLFSLLFLLILPTFAEIVEKTFYFSNYSVNTTGNYQTISFPDTRLSGLPGEPVLPYQAISLLLPPGEAAVSIEVDGEDETSVPGSFLLFPQQQVRPISKGASGTFLKNENIYSLNGKYPSSPTGHLMTQFLNGYGFALCTFTPVSYNPAKGSLSYYRKVTVRINTKQDISAQIALKNLTQSSDALKRVREFAQNPEMTDHYPMIKSMTSGYQILIITSDTFQNGFQSLISMYAGKGLSTQIKTVESISGSVTGIDLQEKIRNYIINEYQAKGINYVLLGGNPQIVPYRGFYCHVISGGGYDDWNIPADLYYSGLDGNYDANGNHTYGEVDDDPDLLPDIAVSRFTFDNATELQNIVHKSVSYQMAPVLGEFKRPFLVAEHLYDNPLTEGSDYLNLIIDDHTDNGYFTHGIPSAANDIHKLYDSVITQTPSLQIWSWGADSMLEVINNGVQFIHHCGHSNTNYMMRLMDYDITDANFYNLDGIVHNYTLMYSHGCNCGGFDDPSCIAKRALSIENFLAGGVFNSRYGWFDEGTTEGPSEHLHREFVSALYSDTTPEHHLGTVHMISKIKTAPWVGLPGEFEPGAQRWCHYCCNAFGDPALEIWTDNPSPTGITQVNKEMNVTLYPNPASDNTTITVSANVSSTIKITVFNLLGNETLLSFSRQVNRSTPEQIRLDLSMLGAGTYFCRIGNGKTTEVRKLVVVK